MLIEPKPQRIDEEGRIHFVGSLASGLVWADEEVAQEQRDEKYLLEIIDRTNASWHGWDSLSGKADSLELAGLGSH